MFSLPCFNSAGCTARAVRLVGQTEFEGRVEVCNNGEWGTICDNQWDLSDSQVVCRQLGFGRALRAPLEAAYGMGPDDQAIVFDEMRCGGTETNIFDCTSSTVGMITNCTHNNDASVWCEGTSTIIVITVCIDREHTYRSLLHWRRETGGGYEHTGRSCGSVQQWCLGYSV